MSKSMKKGTMLAALVMSIGLAGCASTATDLADRVSALESAVAAAQSTASDASATANQAMEAASSAQACCDANRERIGRMFEKASSK